MKFKFAIRFIFHFTHYTLSNHFRKKDCNMTSKSKSRLGLSTIKKIIIIIIIYYTDNILCEKSQQYKSQDTIVIIWHIRLLVF